MKAYKIWCEWDIGEEDEIYTDIADAEASLAHNPNVDQLIKDMGFSGIDEIFSAGLLEIQEINLRKKNA